MYSSGKFVAASFAAFLLSSTSVLADTVVEQGSSAAGGQVINSGNVTNDADIDIGGSAFTTGIGSLISATATGAAGTVGVSGIGQFDNKPNGGFGNITQDIRNSGVIRNLPQTFEIPGSSSLSNGSNIISGAQGASASVSVNALEGDNFTRVGMGRVNQTSTNTSAGTVINRVGLNLRDVELSGAGSAVSAYATGASSSVSSSSITASPDRGNRIGLILGGAVQTSVNAAPVTNILERSLAIGDLSGTGASVAVNATGASSSIASMSIDTVGPMDININGGINQTATNSGTVINGTSELPVNITSGVLSGVGTSVQTSAVGASSAINFGSIAGGTIAALVREGEVSSNIRQTAINGATGTIVNRGSISTGALSGMGTSVSMNAIGASAALSVSTIGSTTTRNAPVGNINAPRIIQRASNAANVTNTVTIDTGNITGTGASVSAAAVGASASVSHSTIASSM